MMFAYACTLLKSLCMVRRVLGQRFSCFLCGASLNPLTRVILCNIEFHRNSSCFSKVNKN